MSDFITPPMPKWLREFANSELHKNAGNSQASVEEAVKELRSRVGLDLVTGDEEFLQEKKATKVAKNVYQKVENEIAKDTKRDYLPGGLGDSRPDSDFDPVQLAMGIKVELEHTDDIELAKEITKDHLSEMPDYYTHLRDMEKKYGSKLLALVAFANLLEDNGQEESAKNIDEQIRGILSDPVELAYHAIEHDLEPGSKEAAELSELIYDVKEGKADKADLQKKLNELNVSCEICGDTRSLSSEQGEWASCPGCGQNAKDKKEKKESVFDEFPKLKVFIDNVCQSRQGHVTMPAILKMLRDERPEKVDVDSEELHDYIEKRIKEEKVDLPDLGDDVAGLSMTVFIVDEMDDDNKEMFDKPAK